MIFYARWRNFFAACERKNRAMMVRTVFEVNFRFFPGILSAWSEAHQSIPERQSTCLWK